ncbi:MAG: HAMP domain-containing histidine kinase [Saprospiraceae bacterium]|nr:HAMP domain-containing histidine kinase [Saprospiraceae bacterium]
MQIRTRLTLWFIAITAFLLLSSLFFIYYNFSNHVKSEYYKSLQSKALMTVAMLSKNKPEILEFGQKNEEDLGILPTRDNILIYNTQLKKLFSFNSENEISEQTLKSILKNGEYKFKLGTYDAIGIKYTTNFGKELIIIAKGMIMSEELVRLRNILIMTFFIFLAFTALGGYYFSNKALHPITKTMNEIDNILPSDLSKRLHVDKNKDELSRLSITFNRLLDRIEDAFNIQKGFLSNVSHELRNPLASIISSIQVNLTKNRSEQEYKNCLENVLLEATELEHTSTQLMDLARISAKSDKILFGNLRIDELVWQAISIVGKTNAKYNFKVETEGMPEDQNQLIVNANESLLKTALINLIENACKFSKDNTANISVFSETEQLISVEIKDSARIIQEDEKEQIFKPFYRSEETKKIKGFGIGLSLVATILNTHEAKLSIRNNQNIGNIFKIQFKKAN